MEIEKKWVGGTSLTDHEIKEAEGVTTEVTALIKAGNKKHNELKRWVYYK